MISWKVEKLIRRTSLKSTLLTPRNLNIVLLIIIIGIGAILRFYRLGYQSFWNDEASSIIDAKSDLYNLVHPPLSYVLLRIFLETLGTNEFTARLPSCLFGIATIPLVYMFGKQLFGEKEGLIASFIVSVIPWYIRWSQEARMYTELTVFTILALYFFYRAIQKESLNNFVLSSVLTALAFYTHYSAILIVPIIALWLILKQRSNNNYKSVNYWHLAIFFGLFFILCLALLLTLFPQMLEFKFEESEYRFGKDLPGLLSELLFKYKFGPILPFFSIVGAIYLISQRNSAGYLMTTYAVIPAIVFSSLTFVANITTRYFLFTLPAYALLTSRLTMVIFEGIMKGKIMDIFHSPLLKNLNISKVFAWGFLAVVVIGASNLPFLYKFYTTEGHHHADWKSACAYVELRMHPEDIIASEDGKAVYYYLGKLDYDLSVEFFEPSIFDEIKNSQERVWLLIKGLDTIDPDYEFRNWVYSNCEKMKEVHLVTVYLYTPQN